MNLQKEEMRDDQLWETDLARFSKPDPPQQSNNCCDPEQQENTQMLCDHGEFVSILRLKSRAVESW